MYIWQFPVTDDWTEGLYMVWPFYVHREEIMMMKTKELCKQFAELYDISE